MSWPDDDLQLPRPSTVRQHLWYWLHALTFRLAEWALRRYLRSTVPAACGDLISRIQVIREIDLRHLPTPNPASREDPRD
jgi:hypothetical protein